MKFNKELREKMLKRYGELRNAGLSTRECESKLIKEFKVKGASSIRKAYTDMQKKVYVDIKDDAMLKDIINAKSDLLINRKINILMNKDLHKQANDNARWELIKEALTKFQPKHLKYPFKNNISKPKLNKEDMDVIYILGDIHYRGIQDRDLVVEAFNKINLEVLRKDYRNVTLILTGDNVDGEIHTEQQRTNEPVIETTMQITNLLCECINCNPNIKQVYMVYGNHEEIRLWGDKGTTNNVGKFIYWGLKNCLKYAKVEASNELYFEYKGKRILLLHGHQNYAKSKTRLIDHCAVTYKIQPDYIILGHFHTSKANQFSKNQWLITAPALKNWESDWDRNNGYCGLGQYVKLKLNWTTPQITTINVKENKYGR